MKIAMSLEEMSPGGGPRFILNLGQYLIGAGHSVTVVTAEKGEWWPELAACGLAAYCLPPRPWASFAGRAKQLANYWNSQHFDVIIANVSALNHLAQCALHLVADRTAVVLVLHGDWEQLYNLSDRHIAAWNCAVGVSPKVYEAAVARFPHKPVFCIPNGVEEPTPVQLKARLDWELPLSLFFVGRLIDAHKGVFRLPAILAGCRARNLPVRLTVIGDGKDGQHLAHLFGEAGVDDLVEMMGMQPPSVIGAAMRRHHILVFPTNTEGMPLVVLEAQANGCVPITTRLPGITDVAIEDRVTGRLVEPGNIEQFVDHIAAMITPAVWQSHSRAAMERAARLFSLAQMGAEYAHLLDALAQGAYPIRRPYNQSHRLSAVPFRGRDYLPLFLLRWTPAFVLRGLGRTRRWLKRLPSSVRNG